VSPYLSCASPAKFVPNTIGQHLEGEGTWRNLPLSAVEPKFRSVVGGLLDAVRAARLVALVSELPRAHSTEQFFEALAGTSALHTREGETP